MQYIGIDLSGPSNCKDTVLVAFKSSGFGNVRLDHAIEGADDHDILHFACGIMRQEPLVIGIDAPLSYNIGGGDRPADADLRSRIVAAGLRSGSVMPPTMTRMVYLALRGISIARLLLSLKKAVKIVEVHPGGVMALRGASVCDVVEFKKKRSSRLRLLAWLEKQGLEQAAHVQDPSDHYVAACAAALAAWQWSKKKSVWIHMAEPPIHPFDYTC